MSSATIYKNRDLEEGPMHLELTEEQEFFRETTHRFLEREAPIAVVRELYESRDGFNHDWWRRGADIGWTSLFVSESFGGGSLSGRPTADAVIAAEEMGRVVAPGPFLPVNIVAAALSAQGTDEHRTSVLPGLVSGETIAAWAFAESSGRWDPEPESFSTTAQIHGTTLTLNGSKAFVEAAGSAAHVLVTARTDDGLTQVLVPANTDGMTVTRGRSIDMTRRFGRVTFESARVPVSSVVGEVGGAADMVAYQWRIAIALQCAGLVGVADKTMESTLEYGRDRIAFGRPIVSFQALKHRIADMAVFLEGSKAVCDALAAAIDSDALDAPRLASVAKAYVGEHVLDIVDDCVQITGGIAVTWEHDIHIYNRRAALDRAVFGSPEEHKQRLVAALAAEGSAS